MGKEVSSSSEGSGKARKVVKRKGCVRREKVQENKDWRTVHDKA
ncbi:uncharacterized protein G2W53_023556 [Senna tora]|uniref:Uncharacterized protein n=1 Tax=Senna tora TaxID=362788 RepID=A0A834TBP6_9FABA|nr:uncharacterized protein G2W53_023556 [Senna tora]